LECNRYRTLDIYHIPKSRKGTKEAKSGGGQAAAPEQRMTKTKETIVETSIKKGQQSKSGYENRSKDKKDQKACC